MGVGKKIRYYSSLEGYTSIIINLILAALKYWAGIISGSVALIADAWHTLTDSISSVIVIIGSRISSKPPDKNHPFGHGRFEFISTFLIALLLFIVAYAFFRESVEKLSDHQSASYGTVAIIIIIVSIISKEALAQLAFWAGRKSGSPTLKADGWHHRTDSISSVIILIGIIFGKQFWWIDGVLGIIIALFIAWTAFQIIHGTVSSIMGESPDEKIIKRVKEISTQIAGDRSEAHQFSFHDYVTRKELIFHIRLSRLMNIEEAHEIVSKIESSIKHELDINATIHIEPNYHNSDDRKESSREN